MSEHKNMCDGCERKLPIVEGMHKEPSTYGWTYCTKDRYVPTEECKCEFTADMGDGTIRCNDCKTMKVKTVKSTTDQEVKCCHHKDSAQTCIQYAKEAFEKGQQFSVSEAVKKERSELLSKLDRFGGFCTNCRDRFKDMIIKEELIRSREQ